MAIKPMGDRVLIQRVEPADQKKGGIYIPDTAKEKPQEGEVVALGTGPVLEDGTRVDFEVKVGDRVLFGKYAGTEVTAEGETYLLMSENEILAVVS